MKYGITDLCGAAQELKAPFELKGKKKVSILALGDVGGTLLMALKLLGADVIEEIGIYDINEKTASRYEMEMNQMSYPFGEISLPAVRIIPTGEEKSLFDSDVFIFCASKAVPSLSEKNVDVRMVQFEGNKPLVSHYAKMAAEQEFKGLFAVVSDPVDPLCMAAYRAGEGKLQAGQIQGFGLGVMNSRARYYAEKNEKFRSFLKEGRAFGPHGSDLVIANSIENYDDDLSKELTELAVKSNLETRKLGFKPYMAPAVSSGALSILLLLRGEWHYSSNFIGNGMEGAFMGALNRIKGGVTEFENAEMPERLFKRIKRAYDNLKEIV